MVSRDAKIPRARRRPNESLMSVGWAARIPLVPSLPRPRPHNVSTYRHSRVKQLLSSSLIVIMVIIIPFAFLSSRRSLRFFNRRVATLDKISLERVKHLAPDAHKSAVPTHGEPARPAARMDGENGSEKAPFVPTIKTREGSEVLALKKGPLPSSAAPALSLGHRCLRE